MNQLQGAEECREQLMAGSFHHSFNKCLLAASVNERVCGGHRGHCSGTQLRNLKVLTGENRNSTARLKGPADPNW